MYVIFNNILLHLQFRKMWNLKRDFTYIRLCRAIKGHGVTITCILFPNTEFVKL
jgi:hypothetical protein